MRFGSLFSGIGGFDLGFEQAGLSSVWQVEIDKDCNRVLEKHWQDVRRYEDVSTVGKLESVDVICGGFPCQDLSVAGKRKGLAGERSGLWFEFLRIIELNRPRFIVIENVPGLLSSWSPVELPPDAVEGCEWDVEENSDFEIILIGLSELGYCVASRILDAQYDGVAQRRERVFIVGSLGDGSCAQILFESESVSWNPPTRREAGAGVAPTVRGGTANGSNEFGNKIGVLPVNGGAEFRESDSGGVSSGTRSDGNSEATRAGRGCLSDVAATLDQRGRGPTDAVMMNLQVAHALRSEGADASEDGTGRGTPIIAAPLTANYGKQLDNSDRNGGPPNIVNCFNGYTGGPDDNDAQANHLIAFSSKDHGADAGEIAPTLRSQNFKDSHMNGGGQAAIAFTENMRGEVRGTHYANALGQGGGKPGQGYAAALTRFGVRRLTPRECELLQGFPADWTRYDANGKEISDSARYRMLGNAVCVNVAKWIGKRILESI